jgi:crossover junction endodeoxyribonuclease RuvC
MESEMKILGIDPGTIRMGVGLITSEKDEMQIVLAETIKTHSKRPISERLKQLYQSLSEIFQIYRPDEVALESVLFSKDFRSAIKIGEARAIAMLVSSQFSVPICEYSPTSVKKAVCGNGQAKKHQVQFMIRSLFKLRQTPEVDTSDGLALAVCHLRNLKFKRKISAKSTAKSRGVKTNVSIY